jgi:hypothetical protein
MEHPNLVVIHSYPSQAEADLAKAALESAGIPAMTSADTAGRMRDHLAWSGAGFQLIVRQDDAAEARALLDETVTEETEEDSSGKDPGGVQGLPS